MVELNLRCYPLNNNYVIIQDYIISLFSLTSEMLFVIVESQERNSLKKKLARTTELKPCQSICGLIYSI